MTPPKPSPVVSFFQGHPPTSPETEVKARVLAWCSAWSSINGHFQTDQLREIALDGPLRMAADFGHQMAVSVTLEAYAAFWSPLLSQAFSEWFLLIDSPVEITIFNNVATADFQTRLQGITHDGSRRDQRHHTKQILEHVSGTWRLVQEQITVAPDKACL